jgi:dihydroorotase
MRRALEVLATLGLPLSEHSEDPAIRGNGVMHEGAVSERLGLPGEPGASESVAIARNIALAELTGAHLHIAHISARRSVELVAEAKARGVRVTAEVTPSHLFLTDAAVFGGGDEPAYDANARINPPLRTEDDRRALVQGLADGTIDVIATDHAPHALVDKQCEFEDAAPGISCLETALATVLTLVERGELPLERTLAALTSRPAAVFALDRRVPGLGTLAEGSPADIAIIKLGVRWIVDPGAFVSRGKNSPLGGVELAGQVRATLVAGKPVFGDAESMEGA